MTPDEMRDACIVDWRCHIGNRPGAEQRQHLNWFKEIATDAEITDYYIRYLAKDRPRNSP